MKKAPHVLRFEELVKKKKRTPEEKKEIHELQNRIWDEWHKKESKTEK
jgi:hypothetical protein